MDLTGTTRSGSTRKLRYPKRAGGYDWEGGKKAWKARLREGHTWEQLYAGIDDYHAYCDDSKKSGTEFVMSMKTFCGPGKRFLEDWKSARGAPENGTWEPPIEDPPEVDDGQPA